MRRSGFVAPGLYIVLTLLFMAGVAPVAARQDATPAAAQPTQESAQPTEAAAQPAGTPVPAAAETPAPPAQSNVVTLVTWYENAADQDIINLYPLVIDAQAIAGRAPNAQAIGTADFPLEEAPRITLGETTFESYPRPDGVIERWTWLDDFEGARPGTLVMQVSGVGGAYQDFYGTATFVSRDTGGAGGVLTIALRPPDPAVAEGEAAAEEAAPAEEPVAEEPVAEEPVADAAAEDAAEVPVATLDPGTTILTEPEIEGEVPVVTEEGGGEAGA